MLILSGCVVLVDHISYFPSAFGKHCNHPLWRGSTCFFLWVFFFSPLFYFIFLFLGVFLFFFPFFRSLPREFGADIVSMVLAALYFQVLWAAHVVCDICIKYGGSVHDYLHYYFVIIIIIILKYFLSTSY